MSPAIAIPLALVALVLVATIGCWWFVRSGDPDRARIQTCIQRKYPGLRITGIEHVIRKEDGTRMGDVSDLKGRMYRVMGDTGGKKTTIKVRTSRMLGVVVDSVSKQDA